VKAWRQQKLALVAEPDERHEPMRLAPEQAEAGVAAGQAVRPTTREEVQADLRRMPLLRGLPLPEALLRAAMRRERYRVLPPQAPREGEADAPHRLVLGPDEHGRWWLLGEFAGEAAARRAAGSLRLFMLHLSQESEGLHVVEHVLLRPLQPGAPAHARLGLADDFYALRVSALLPGWTVRTAQPAFRRFAEETLRINCPAHLALQPQWLDFEAMQRFEARYEAWLGARLALAQAPDDAALLAQADEAACAVIECLLKPHDEADGNEPVLQGHA
jgi:hypothetical protein